MIATHDATNCPKRCQLGRWGECFMDFGVFMCCCLRRCKLTMTLSTWALGSVYDGFWGWPVVFCVMYDGFWGRPVVFCVLWMVRLDSKRFHTTRTNLNKSWQLQKNFWWPQLVGLFDWRPQLFERFDWKWKLVGRFDWPTATRKHSKNNCANEKVCKYQIIIFSYEFEN